MQKPTIEVCPATDPGTLKLASRAWVFYGDSSSELSIAEHKINNAGTVYPATWLDHDAIKKEVMTWQERQEHNISPAFLPYRMLSVCDGEIIWHVPASKRTLHFTAKEHAAHNGKRLQIPHLVFRASTKRGVLKVFALNLSRTATFREDTPLYIAPFPNTYKDGGVCIGTMEEHGYTPPDAEKWTDSFFESEFTHATDIKYWSAVAAGKSPALKPAGLTLNQFIHQ